MGTCKFRSVGGHLGVMEAAEPQIADLERVRRSDARRAQRLVADCVRLGDDAVGWRTHAMERLCSLLGAKAAIGNEIADFAALSESKWQGVPRGAPARTGSGGPIRIGFSPEELAHWTRYAEETPVHVTPEFTPLSKGDGVCITRLRRDMWDDASWYRSRTYREHHAPAGIDDYVMSVCRIPGTDRSSSLWFHGAVDGPRFGRRHWYLVELVHRGLASLIGGPLASTLQATPAGLPPRRREALGHLLEGLSEKQLAGAMDIKVTTAHEHVQAIYRHFDVASRAELMGEFIRRARPAR